MDATETAKILKEVLPPNQAEAARLLGVSQAAISKLLAGKSRPSPKTARAAEATGKVTRYQLLPDVFGDDPALPPTDEASRCTTIQKISETAKSRSGSKKKLSR